MNFFRRGLRSAVAWALPVLVAFAPSPLTAIEITPGGLFIFDINSDADMREVGTRSGIQTKEDAPLSLGIQECRRWANQFRVSPYRAVVSGTLPGRPGRVWICAGQANHEGLSRQYCQQMGMPFVKHEGSKVTCRMTDRS